MPRNLEGKRKEKSNTLMRTGGSTHSFISRLRFDIPWGRYPRNVDKINISLHVVKSLTLSHVHARTTSDETQLRPFDPLITVSSCISADENVTHKSQSSRDPPP